MCRQSPEHSYIGQTSIHNGSGSGSKETNKIYYQEVVWVHDRGLSYGKEEAKILCDLISQHVANFINIPI